MKTLCHEGVLRNSNHLYHSASPQKEINMGVGREIK